jgi:hypothetical protein
MTYGALNAERDVLAATVCQSARLAGANIFQPSGQLFSSVER